MEQVEGDVNVLEFILPHCTNHHKLELKCVPRAKPNIPEGFKVIPRSFWLERKHLQPNLDANNTDAIQKENATRIEETEVSKENMKNDIESSVQALDASIQESNDSWHLSCPNSIDIKENEYVDSEESTHVAKRSKCG